MRVGLIIALVCYGSFVWWLVDSLQLVSQQISSTQQKLAEPPTTPVAIIRFDGVKQGLVVPSWSWIETEGRWVYVSSNWPIDKSFTPELTNISVPTGNWLSDKRLHPEAETALQSLFQAAKMSDHPLIVTSAYRTAKSQQQLLESSSLNYGNIWANSHVADPGQSEHQLGLAVDLSYFTDICQQNFANCHLRSETAEWLAVNSANHGFILRYPESKAEITGVNYEPWHFRYVGQKMAKLVHESGLTFDEISQIILAKRAELTEQTTTF